MRRGDIVAVAAPGDFGKPRPAVIIQGDALNNAGASSTIVALMTSRLRDAPLLRLTIEPEAFERAGKNLPGSDQPDSDHTDRKNRRHHRQAERPATSRTQPPPRPGLRAGLIGCWLSMVVVRLLVACWLLVLVVSCWLLVGRKRRHRPAERPPTGQRAARVNREPSLSTMVTNAIAFVIPLTPKT